MFKLNKLRTKWQIFQNKRTTPAALIAIIYLWIVLLAACLLMIPGIVHQNGTITTSSHQGTKTITVKFGWNFLVALFNCCSAFSDTGLVVGSIGSNYSFGGQFIILLLIEIGGVGVLTMKTFLLLTIGKMIKHSFFDSYQSLVILNEERGGTGPQQIKKIVIFNFIWLLVLQTISTICLSLGFFYTSVASDSSTHLRHNFEKSFWTAVFASVSAVNNAGMDIILGSQSFQAYDHNYFVQWVIIFDFVCGGLGFITWYDLWNSKLHKKKSRQPLSLFSKINLIVYFGVAVVGVAGVGIIESSQSSKLARNSANNWDFFMKIFFNTMSTRNAGFDTCDINLFRDESKMIHIIMMFIGSAPSSTAGGIRTTTLGVLLLTLWDTLRRKPQVTMGNRTLSPTTIRQSNMIFFISTCLIGIVSLWCVPLIENYQTNSNRTNIIYMIMSGFGTVGLNPMPNIFYNPHAGGQIIVALTMILVMFIGQLGVGNILTIHPNQAPGRNYPVQTIKVG